MSLLASHPRPQLNLFCHVQPLPLMTSYQISLSSFENEILGFPAPMSFFLCGKLTAMYPKGSLMDWIRRRRQHGRRDGLWLERQPPLRPHMATIISLQSAEFSGLNRGQSGTSSVRIHIHVWFHNRVCVWLLFTTSKLPLTSSDNICEQWLGCPPGLAKGPNLWDCLRLPSPSHRCAFREGKLAR